MSAPDQADLQRADAHTSSRFSVASSDFKSKLPESLVDNFIEIRTLQDLERAIKNIETQQVDRKSLRCLNKIKPFLKALDEYSKTIEVFVNAKPDIMAFVWGPIKVCLLIASKFDKAFGSLLGTYIRIKDALPHFQEIEHLFGTNPIVCQVLTNVYKDILSFHLRALEFFTQKGWRIALRMSCRTLEDMFDDVISNLERSRELLYSSATIAHYQAAQESRRQIDKTFKIQQETARTQKRAVVQTWLNPIEHYKWHEQICELRDQYPQTAKWMFEESCWRSWLNDGTGQGKTLWVWGIPGAGKTVIFSSMVGELLSRYENSKSTIIIYLYCKYNDQGRSSFTELVRSLIYQLAGSRDVCYDYLFDVASHSVERNASKRQVLTTIIQDLLQCYDDVFIGIDGLDECEQAERVAILRLLKELQKLPTSTVNLYLFVTSRAELDIDRFMTTTPYHISIAPNHLAGDIKYYIAERSKELERFRLVKKELEDLCSEIYERSAGMFLLTRLIFDLFEQCTTRADFDGEYAEKRLPRGIDQAYGRIVSYIEIRDTESGRTSAKRVLEILSSARRKLLISELQGMLSMDIVNHSFDFDKRRYTKHFKEICGPLVELSSDGTIDLVHQTVKQYLDQYHFDYVKHETAELTCTKICTSYLALDCFQSTLDDQKLHGAAIKGEFAFYKYAILQWLPHLHSLQVNEESETRINPDFKNKVQAVCKNLIPATDCCLNSESGSGGHGLAGVLERLEASYKIDQDDGHSPILQQILRIQTFIEGAISQQKGGSDRLLLDEAYGLRPYACQDFCCTRFLYGFSTSQDRDTHMKGHQRQFKCPFEDCNFSLISFPTKSTLEAHLDMVHVSPLGLQFSDLRPFSIWTALSEAVESDDEVLVEELCIEAKNSLEIQRPDGLVGKAVMTGHLNSAKVMLRHFRSPSDWLDNETIITSVPILRMMKILIKHGDVSLLQEMLVCISRGEYERCGISILYEAILTRRRDVITVLLEHHLLQKKPVISHQSTQVIGKLAESGNIDILANEISLLGAHCTSEDLASCCSTLAAKGYTRSLQTVLPYFLNRDTHALKRMKRFRHLKELPTADAVSRLISELSVNSRGNPHNYRGLFQRAALNADLDGLTRMLNLGVHIDDVNGTVGTALQAAARRGHVNVVQWLLEHGAQAGAIGGQYGSPLAAAAAKGHTEVMKILLATGLSASQEARTIKTQAQQSKLRLISRPHIATPLHFAAAELQEEAVDELIQAKADVTAIDSNGNTPLHVCVLGPYSPARSHRHQDSLFCREARQVFTSEFERMESSLVRVANLLLKNGAIANARNFDDESPLHLLLCDDADSESFSEHPCALEMTKVLVKAGADLDALSNRGAGACGALRNINDGLLEDMKQVVSAAGGGSIKPIDVIPIQSPGLPGSSIDAENVMQVDTPQEFEDDGQLDTFDKEDSFPSDGESCRSSVILFTSDQTVQGIEAHTNGGDGVRESVRNQQDISSESTRAQNARFVYTDDERDLLIQVSDSSYADLFMNPWNAP